MPPRPIASNALYPPGACAASAIAAPLEKGEAKPPRRGLPRARRAGGTGPEPPGSPVGPTVLGCWRLAPGSWPKASDPKGPADRQAPIANRVRAETPRCRPDPYLERHNRRRA
ncbi:MAG: hypothetical protein Kow0092_29050 [Deferrisomatales bacterium]